MKRSWNEANDDETDDLDEQEAEDWSASSALILSPSSKDTSKPFQIVPSKFGPHAYTDQNEHKRTIVHVDLDCFYAQVEMIRNPELRKKPLGIQQKNIIVTCNYVAREYGLTKLMCIPDAKKKCPNLVLVSGEDLTHYREYSQKVSDLLQSEFSSLVERLGFDENFVDVSSLVEERMKTYQGKPKIEVRGHIFGSENEGTSPQCSCGCHQRLALGSQIAAEMRERVREVLGLTGCAGIAWNKLLAKLVGEKHKPNDQTTLFPGKEQQLMIGLGKVRKIPGIGHSMNKKLATLGITTVEDLQKASSAELEPVFGSQSTAMMKNSSFGIDNSPVNKSGLPQTMSDEDSFKKCATLPDVMETMMNLLDKLSERLQKDGRVPQTIRLSVRKFSATQKWHRESRQTNLPIQVTSQIRKGIYSVSDSMLEVLMGLFNKMVDTHKPFHLTLINICFANFQEKSSPAKSLDTYFLKDKISSGEKELIQKRKIEKDTVSAALTTEGDKVIPSEMTKEKKSGALEKYFKKHKNYDKKIATNGQQQRSCFRLKSAEMSSGKIACDSNQDLSIPHKDPALESHSCIKEASVSDNQSTSNDDKKIATNGQQQRSFFRLKSAEMSSAKIACDSNQDISIPNKDPALESHSCIKEASVSDNQSTSKDVTHTESFRASVCETGGKTVILKDASDNDCHRAYKVHSTGLLNVTDLEKELYSLPRISGESTVPLKASNADVNCQLDATLETESIQQSCESSSSSVEIPPNVDEAVFRSLPPDIREELLKEWRRKNRQSVGSKSEPSQKSLSTSNKRITDFFGKS